MKPYHQVRTGPEAEADWENLLARLSACRRHQSERDDSSAARVREILAARARKLRQEEKTAALDGDEDFSTVLTFRLGEDRFAFPLEAVAEVGPQLPVTAIPNTPPFVLGVVNLRGRIYSVLDLRRLLGLSSPAAPTGNGRLLFLAAPEMEFAVPIDELLQVSRLSRKALQTQFATLSGRAARYFKGVTSERLVVLDAMAMLTDEELIVR